MVIKVTRAQAIDALMQGKRVWFGPAARSELACSFEFGRRPRSRRQAANLPNRCVRGLLPKGTKMAWWVTL